MTRRERSPDELYQNQELVVEIGGRREDERAWLDDEENESDRDEYGDNDIGNGLAPAPSLVVDEERSGALQL